jgi:hypothetical protein
MGVSFSFGLLNSMASLSPNLAPAWKTRLNLPGFTLGKNRTIPSSIISPAFWPRMFEFLLEDSPAQFLSARPKAQFLIGCLSSASTLGSQETFWLGNVGADLCEKFDGLHFGIFRAGQ